MESDKTIKEIWDDFMKYKKDCLSKQEVLNILESKNIPVSRRALSYYSTYNLISKSFRYGRKCFYHKSIIDEIVCVQLLLTKYGFTIKELQRLGRHYLELLLDVQEKEN